GRPDRVYFSTFVNFLDIIYELVYCGWRRVVFSIILVVALCIILDFARKFISNCMVARIKPPAVLSPAGPLITNPSVAGINWNVSAIEQVLRYLCWNW